MTTRLKISQQDAEVPTASRGVVEVIIPGFRFVILLKETTFWISGASLIICITGCGRKDTPKMSVSYLLFTYVPHVRVGPTYRPYPVRTVSTHVRIHPYHTTMTILRVVLEVICADFLWTLRPHAICYDREYSTRPVRSTYVNYSCICCIHAEARNESVIQATRWFNMNINL